MPLCFLPLHKTWVWFLAPKWCLTNACHSSARRSDDYFWPSWAPIRMLFKYTHSGIHTGSVNILKVHNKTYLLVHIIFKYTVQWDYMCSFGHAAVISLHSGTFLSNRDGSFPLIKLPLHCLHPAPLASVTLVSRAPPVWGPHVCWFMQSRSLI